MFLNFLLSHVCLPLLPRLIHGEQFLDVDRGHGKQIGKRHIEFGGQRTKRPEPEETFDLGNVAVSTG